MKYNQILLFKFPDEQYICSIKRRTPEFFLVEPIVHTSKYAASFSWENKQSKVYKIMTLRVLILMCTCIEELFALLPSNK